MKGDEVVSEPKVSQKDIWDFDEIISDTKNFIKHRQKILDYFDKIPLNAVPYSSGPALLHFIVRLIEDEFVLNKAINAAKKNDWLELKTATLLVTPLVSAMVAGNLKAVELLIAAGADISVVVKEGKTGIPKLNIFACAAKWQLSGQKKFFDYLLLFKKYDLKIKGVDALFYLLTDRITFTNEKPLTILQDMYKNYFHSDVMGYMVFDMILSWLRANYGDGFLALCLDKTPAEVVWRPVETENNDEIYHCSLQITDDCHVALSGRIGPGVIIKLQPGSSVTFNGNCEDVTIDTTHNNKIEFGPYFRGNIKNKSGDILDSNLNGVAVVFQKKNCDKPPSITRVSILRPESHSVTASKESKLPKDQVGKRLRSSL